MKKAFWQGIAVLVGGWAVLMGCMIALALLGPGCSPSKPKKCRNYKIIKVGGCDKYGDCGVLLKGYGKSTVYYPVEGATVRKCR